MRVRTWMALCSLSLVSIRQTACTCTHGNWGSPSEGMPCKECPEGATCEKECPEGATCEVPVNKWPRVRAGFFAKPAVRACLLGQPANKKNGCFLKCLPKGEQCHSYDEQLSLQSKMKTTRPLCHDVDNRSNHNHTRSRMVPCDQ